jgi:hypothetical protein
LHLGVQGTILLADASRRDVALQPNKPNHLATGCQSQEEKTRKGVREGEREREREREREVGLEKAHGVGTIKLSGELDPRSFQCFQRFLKR